MSVCESSVTPSACPFYLSSTSPFPLPIDSTSGVRRANVRKSNTHSSLFSTATRVAIEFSTQKMDKREKERMSRKEKNGNKFLT